MDRITITAMALGHEIDDEVYAVITDSPRNNGGGAWNLARFGSKARARGTWYANYGNCAVYKMVGTWVRVTPEELGITEDKQKAAEAKKRRDKR